jgi:4'-phosphopantetheinyl transferase
MNSGAMNSGARTATVVVWFFRSDEPDTAVADLAALLDDGEIGRAEQIRRDVDRRRFVVAHGVARVLVGRHLGVPAGQLRWRRGPHGKPELCGAWTGAQVNLSHSGDLNAVAITASRRVGVDVQQLVQHLDAAALASRFFPPGEARYVSSTTDPAARAVRFARLWTRKEACVKAVGATLVQGLPLPVRGPQSRRAAVVEHPSGALPGPVRVSDVPAPPGFRAAVALEGADTYRVVRRWWRG